MRSGFFIIASVLISTVSFADVTFTTHDTAGKPIAVFTQVEGPNGPDGSFGNAWMDPGGKMWTSSYIGYYANNSLVPDQNGQVIDSPAVEACKKIGGRLLNDADMYKLLTYFELTPGSSDPSNAPTLTVQGAKDLQFLFPDMIKLGFWGATVDDYWGVSIYRFQLAGDGTVYFYTDSAYLFKYASVRCVAQKNQGES